MSSYETFQVTGNESQSWNGWGMKRKTELHSAMFNQKSINHFKRNMAYLKDKNYL